MIVFSNGSKVVHANDDSRVVQDRNLFEYFSKYGLHQKVIAIFIAYTIYLETLAENWDSKCRTKIAEFAVTDDYYYCLGYCPAISSLILR